MRAAAVLFAATLTAATLSARAQWTIQTPTTADLRGIDNVGKGIAWASGTNGTVLRTEDGGYLWQRCTIPPNAEHLDFRGIQAFDANTAIVMSSGTGDQSRLYKTTDGCQTWKLLFTNPDKEGFWDSIKFTSRDYTRRKGQCFGVMVGDPVDGLFPVFMTIDCGDTWTRQATLPKALSKEGVFAASNSSLSLAINRTFVTGGPSGGRVLDFSTNVGSYAPDGTHPTNPPPYIINTWQSDVLPGSQTSVSSGGFSIGIAERDGQTVRVVVGGDYNHTDRREGTAWYCGCHHDSCGYQPSITPPHGFRSAVAYDAPSKTWITVGPNGTDISTDDGRNWRPLHPTNHDAPDADQHWNALSLPYAVGPHGRIGILNPSALQPSPTKP